MQEKNNIESNPKEKNSFFFGIVTGVAIIAVVGFFIMMGLYLKQDKNSNPSTPQVVNNEENSGQPDQPVSLEGLEVKSTDHVRGNKDAKITIVEYSDFQCPYCSSFHTTMQQVMQVYPNDVKWVYRHFPLDSIHPVARKAAEASECAADQGKFWEYTDEVFANQKGLTLDGLSTIAGTVG
ncbi:MAG: DsbA family protein, partial [Patescibacteria group bacterium]